MNNLRYIKYPAFLVPAFAMGISMASADDHDCDCPCDQERASVSAERDGDRPVAGEMHQNSARDNAVFTSSRSDKPNASASSRPSANVGNAAKSENDRDNNTNYLAAKPAGNFFSTNIIGQEVTNNRNDEVIGTVEEILIDRNGQVGAVVLSIGGLMGLGEKDVAIAWDQIDRTMDDDNEVKLSVDFSEASLADAPKFDRK